MAKAATTRKHAASKATIADMIVPAGEGAALLNLSTERVRQLVADGRIPAAVRKGAYRLGGLVQGYIAFLKDEERAGQRVVAESGVKRAREMEIMQRVRERARVLIVGAEACEALDGILSVVTVELEGLPARFTRDLKQRRLLEAQIDEIRGRILARLDQEVLALRAGEASISAEDDPDA